MRWVLGESRASALRGETMQDVIFNGSGNRKPLTRASVELIFDNTLGRAAGQWSHYAEISVRRVLQRDGESSYFINNMHVRRRDITDMFLGTGLGPRAYAIIEQGMISRVIEAKPEELRVFLEEAAGVSRYRERRKETEHRLADTRENLARVTDIRIELGTQIDKLDAQAEVATRYQELQARAAVQAAAALVPAPARCGGRARAPCAGDRAASTTSSRPRPRALREVENRIETARAAHYRGGRQPECRPGCAVCSQRRSGAARIRTAARGGEPPAASRASIPNAGPACGMARAARAVDAGAAHVGRALRRREAACRRRTGQPGDRRTCACPSPSAPTAHGRNS